MPGGSAARLVRAFEPPPWTGPSCRAPPGFRRARGDGDGLATFRAACIAAEERQGVPGIMWTAIVEYRKPGVDRREPAAPHERRANLAATSAPERTAALVDDAAASRPRLSRTAIRNLAANRLNTGIALATLALGIAVNTSIFSILLDSVLWRPVPFRDADRLAALANFNVAR